MKQCSYEEKRNFSNKYDQEVLEILDIKIKEDFKLSSEEQDRQENTDAYSMNFNASFRVRKFKDYKLYKKQIVLRFKTKDNGITEFEKIRKGFGDIFFYGFRNEDDTGFIQYIIGSLEILRNYIETKIKEHKKHYRDGEPFFVVDNFDGSKGYAIEIDDIPNFILFSYNYEKYNTTQTNNL